MVHIEDHSDDNDIASGNNSNSNSRLLGGTASGDEIDVDLLPPNKSEGADELIDRETEADAIGDGDGEDDESEPVLTWQELRSKLLRGDASEKSPEAIFLRLFEDRYEIESPVTALSNIKTFLGEYLIQEFNHKDFCSRAGLASEKIIDDDELWQKFADDHLAQHLAVAATLMLRIAMTIAKAFHLQAEDWRDVNQACGKAVRSLPACYKLQRKLPGALNDARALRFLPMPTVDGGEDLNPWKSEVGKELFERAHNVDWNTIEALTISDSKPSCCFSGKFTITEVVASDEFTSVHLAALEEGDPPGAFPTRRLKKGEPILWEVDSSFGKTLEAGFLIDADWYQMESQVCFISALMTVTPSW
eukprot:CAMPEP_0206455238 /NCGR_PEP_ID=MMETSP0324_2-20121206/21636_1 /ASSEMBLY_ACC=CAM_ASM_000836 /TAXON_ID=2866 /ORGANISM="Crypthecodinium cohnii, Strain Seligo" /LENGTH=360 /DNA_ID=CAMNT_0053925909 /DNA_START=174 /DNA_END=1253 /DNA_ORIENTATION=+